MEVKGQGSVVKVLYEHCRRIGVKWDLLVWQLFEAKVADLAMFFFLPQKKAEYTEVSAKKSDHLLSGVQV